MSTGTNIYGPFEAGFQSGFACESGSNGDCDGGVDVPTCYYELQKECDNNAVDAAFFVTFKDPSLVFFLILWSMIM